MTYDPGQVAHMRHVNMLGDDMSDKREGIIVDLDGTLAKNNCSDPYAWELSKDDLVDEVVRDICNQFEEHLDIIIVSGRPEEGREVYEQWCNYVADVQVTAMYLRADDDYRKDSIIKQEIYKRDIQPYWDIKFVLDDRNSVVDMWRSIGLKCLQVQPGDF